METYVLVMFWLQVVGFIIHILGMSYLSWPLESTKSLGMYAAETILGLVLMAWAGIVLWVH